MLSKLRIQNFALITEAEIDFTDGVNTITGETGAGKSIILGALTTLLGERFDKNLLYDTTQKCVVEAEFQTSNLNLEPFYCEHDVDRQEICILRREISKTGKSRSFLNDTPVTLKTIRSFAAHLIDIHAQHDILDLKSVDYQLDTLDAFSRNQQERFDFNSVFQKYKTLNKELLELKERKKQGLAEADYLQFLLNELEEANLESSEEEELIEEKALLENSSELEFDIENAKSLLCQGNANAQELLAQAEESVSRLGSLLNSHDLSQRLKSARLEVEDIYQEIAKTDSIENDPARLAEIEARLQLIYGLEKKHQVKEVSELLEKQQQLNEQLFAFSSIDETIHSLEKEIQSLKETLLSLGMKLSKTRREKAKEMEVHVNSILASIGMPFAIFKIKMETINIEAASSKGMDTLLFELSPDKGNTFGPLNKIASGGELARIMLLLKSMTAEATEIPTLIFDEIDTGISGDVASKVGLLLKEIGQERQVILITHLPQIAASAKHHLFVFKEMIDNKTVTQIRPLNSKERVKELATMLSGKKPTATALKTAKELLAN